MTSRSHGAGVGSGSPFPGMEGLFNLPTPAFEAFASFNGKAFEQMQSLNTEWMRFLQHRMQQDAVFARQLSECKSLPEIFSAYSEFFQAAARDYQTEMASLTRMNQDFATEAASLVREGLAEAQKPAGKR